MKRITSWLPTQVNAFVRTMTWVTLVVQILIVVTGGAVRLTASGLGLVENSNDIRLSLDAYDVSIFDELRADQSIRLNLGGGTLQWLSLIHISEPTRH